MRTRSSRSRNALLIYATAVALFALLPGLKTLPAHMGRILWVKPRKTAGISGLKQVSTGAA